jgi:cell division septation protein DedD
MMSTNVEKYIQELLFEHDCVIIPGFGGFIGNYSPAKINPVYNTFYPPCKSLLFNIHLKQNDGLLASRISQAEQIPYEHAMDLIRKMLVDWNRVLEDGQELVIERVGKIVKEANGILQFEQDTSVNYLPEAFGLTSLVSPAIRRSGRLDEQRKKTDRHIPASTNKSGNVARTLKRAAVLALPIGLATFLSLTHIDQIRNFQQNYSGFLFSKSIPLVKRTNESPKIILSLKKSIPTPKNIVDPNQPVNSGSESQVVKPEVRDAGAPAVNKPYAIIVGAFRFRENAENMVAKLKEEGYDGGIYNVTTTGLFRVSIGSYTSRDEAIRQLAVVRNDNYSSAWLLTK